MRSSGVDPFKDHFSQTAAGYAAHRPTYPRELAAWMATCCTARGVAWDAGCGSGQLSTLLGDHFERVIATDASEKQIERATRHPRVEYRRAKAEASGLDDNSVDLCASAQAAHWFDLTAYFQEVRRVARPGGTLALVSYGIMIVDSAIDAVVMPFYHDTLEQYWPPERRIVEEGYRTIAFPFDELKPPKLEMRARWTLADMIGYIETWSAVWAMAKAAGRGAIEEHHRRLAAAWGDPAAIREVRWPLSIRAAIVKPSASARC
ncbi:MAG: SAM-dependent methyltransferase [Planctomycetota bacterium]|nr:MAG: SAM-dependent methyltransferase [Planctomycetota bacterium]